MVVNLACADVAGVLLECCWLVFAGGQRCPVAAGPAGGGLLQVPQGWAQEGRWAGTTLQVQRWGPSTCSLQSTLRSRCSKLVASGP